MMECLDITTSLFDRRNRFSNSGRVAYGTGMWPFVNPRPWNFTSPPDVGVVIDPVAIASVASESLSKVGWPGIDLMDQNFQMSLIDQPDTVVEADVERWYQNNRDAVCTELLNRVSTYNIDHMSSTAREAMKEAVECYKDGYYLFTVRGLMPEFEAFARSVYGVYGGTKLKPNQKDVIDFLKEAINQLPITDTAAIETFSLHHFIDEKLFAACFTAADAEALGDVPNRHAELHGLASYGNLKGATILLCVTSFLMQLMDRLHSLTVAQSSSS